MRTRKEIEKEWKENSWNGSSSEHNQDLIIELLLDIKELLIREGD